MITIGRASSADRRPTTGSGALARGEASPSSARRSPGVDGLGSGTPSAGSRRSAHELGMWQAKARCSREQAQHCRDFCGRIAGLLERCAELQEAAFGQTQDPVLVREVESFLELHSGVKAGEPVAELLDLRLRIAAATQLSEVEERLGALMSRLGGRSGSASSAGGPYSSPRPERADSKLTRVHRARR